MEESEKLDLDTNMSPEDVEPLRLKLSDQDNEQDKRIFKSPSGASSNLPSIFSKRHSSSLLHNQSYSTQSKLGLQ